MVGERPKPFGEALGFDPITSTLIFGEYDAVLVDAMGTVAEAEALADWVALHNRNLETIYITHAHFDHFYGLRILLDRFSGDRNAQDPERHADVFYSSSGAVGPPALSWASGHQVGCA
jgi:glyoxylase-like metal-dependent hydrolase (beta-lactamase superfamily II)